MFIGSWLTPIWYLIGYFLMALYFTREKGAWFFRTISWVFSLEIYEERQLEFPSKFSTILWFYLFGHAAGLIMIVIMFSFAASIVLYKIGAKAISQVDAVVFPQY